MARAPPIIDFSAAFGNDDTALHQLVDDMRQACIDFGFFQLVNHGVPLELQQEIMDQTKELFHLPVDIKEKYSIEKDRFNRGYERLRAQNFEKRTQGDLKEGYYLGEHLSLDNPRVAAKKFGQGPNKYPAEVPDPEKFKRITQGYHDALMTLSRRILEILALGLNIDRDWFADFAKDPVSILRLLHYPSQPPDASALERGIGAHTDFGAITILLQDMVGGLQIWDRPTSTWVDVTPIPNAYVVNLGNMMMQWTNDKYLSNLHRVINKSGQQRYSVPFFFSGNPDFKVECLPTCRDEVLGAKYQPVTVHEWMTGRYADTYGTKGGKAIGELAAKDVANGVAV